MAGLIELDDRGRIAGLAVVAFDLDHFKGVNDTWDMGDRVLQRFASILQACSRRTDMPCRLGGEEFVSFLVEREPDGVMIYTQRVRKRIEEIDDLSPIPPGCITVSIGTAVHRKGETFDNVLRRADAMLYQAKDAGRNCIRWDEPVSGVREASEAG